MKFGVVSVLCFLIVCVYQCNSFRIIQKIKDYLHPTTTTTVIPILNVYETEDFKERSTTARNTYNTEDHGIEHNSEDLQTSKSPSTFDSSSNRPYTPQNFLTVAPPDVAEVYPGMKKQSTTPRYSSNQTVQPGQANDNYYTDEQEILTTPQTNSAADEVNYGQTTPNTLLDSIIVTTTQKSSDQVNNNQLQNNRNKTSNTQLVSGSSERPLVQPAPTLSTSENDNFIFPDDPSLKEAEAEPEESRRTKNSGRDQLSIPVTPTSPVREDEEGRTIINGPIKDCDEGSQLDGNGKCRAVFRK